MPGSEALAVQVGLGILMGCMSTFGSWREQRGRASSPGPHRMNFLPERVACRQKGGGLSDRQNQQIWPIDALTFKASVLYPQLLVATLPLFREATGRKERGC